MKRNKILLWAAAVCLITFAVWAASPGFTDFLTTQFGITSDNKVVIKQQAVMTNITARARAGVPGMSVEDTSGLGIIFQVRDSTPTTQFYVDLDGSANVNHSLNAAYATASTLSKFDAGKNLVSIPNGFGELTNNGSGSFGWFSIPASNNTFTGNNTFSGQNLFSGATTFSAPVQISANETVSGGLEVTGNLTNDTLTANTLVKANANKVLASIANAPGVLSNDGAGGFSYTTAISGGGSTGSNVTSITIPMGAWFINNVNTGGAISNALAISFTNSADAWGFGHGVTNAIRARLAMPFDWDCQPVKVVLRASCTSANTAPNTNVVFAVRASLLAHGDSEGSPTWSTLQWVTNGISPTPYTNTVAITKFITPGGTLQPTNSILWEIQRLGAAAGDSSVVDTVCLIETQVYYSRTNRTDFPTSTP